MDCQPALQLVECVYRQCVHLREVVKPWPRHPSSLIFHSVLSSFPRLGDGNRSFSKPFFRYHWISSFQPHGATSVTLSTESASNRVIPNGFGPRPLIHTLSDTTERRDDEFVEGLEEILPAVSRAEEFRHTTRPAFQRRHIEVHHIQKPISLHASTRGKSEETAVTLSRAYHRTNLESSFTLSRAKRIPGINIALTLYARTTSHDYFCAMTRNANFTITFTLHARKATRLLLRYHAQR